MFWALVKSWHWLVCKSFFKISLVGSVDDEWHETWRCQAVAESDHIQVGDILLSWGHPQTNYNPVAFKKYQKIMDVGAQFSIVCSPTCCWNIFFLSFFLNAAEWKGEPQGDRGCSVVYSCWSETDVATTTSTRTLRTMVMSHTVKPLWNCHIKWTCCWKLCRLSKFYGLWSRKSLQKQITYRKWKRRACSAKAKVPPRFAIANKLITDFVSPQLPVSWHLHSHSGHQEDIHEKNMSCPF